MSKGGGFILFDSFEGNTCFSQTKSAFEEMADLPSIVETYLVKAGFKAAAAALAKEKTKTTAVRAPSQPDRRHLQP